MKQQLIERIQQLKKQRNAVILVHNYQPAEIHDVADYLGDSLELSRIAAKTEADVIVFCGVHFMAETAAILSPQKTVLLPEPAAGCPMADMINAEKLRALKAQHPKAVVVAYVNTTAEVKAESDICCTSANASAVVAGVQSDEIIFIPDKYLGSYTAQKAGRKAIYFDGFCPVHARILPEYIAAIKQQHPKAEVLVHPECPAAATALADKVLSTTGMCHYVKSSSSTEFIIGTETGIIARMERENPGKQFYPATPLAVCENMKKNSLEKVEAALRDMKHVITVEEPIRSRALAAINKMIAYNRAD